MSTLILSQRDEFFGNAAAARKINEDETNYDNDDDVAEPSEEEEKTTDVTTPASPESSSSTMMDTLTTNHKPDNTSTNDDDKDPKKEKPVPMPSHRNKDNQDLVSMEEDETNHDSSQPSTKEEEDNAIRTVPLEDTPPAATEAAAPVILPTLGGIDNLMNTCYMASAIQLLASVDQPACFGSLLRQHTPQHSSAALRLALVDIWDRLQRGETVRPQHFKNVMDQRSTLFEGIEQQDAHEFLTTLLDLLDEDYKGSLPTTSSSCDNVEMSQTSAAAAATTTPTRSRAGTPMEIDEEHEENVTFTPSKRMKTCCWDEKAREEAEIPSVPTSSSFSNLSMQQIEHLLHGTVASSNRRSLLVPSVAATAPLPLPEPRANDSLQCRLVGGRINIPNESVTATSTANNIPIWNRRHQCLPAAVDTTEASSTTLLRSRNNENDDAVRSTASTAVAGTATEEEAMVTEDEAECTTTKSLVVANRNVSPIDECFTTKVRVCLTCDSCKYSRSNIETYLHWSLEMADNDDSASVDDVVRQFFDEERREIKCEKCFADSATQVTEIIQLPKLLLLHFKRFVVKVSADYSDISYEKNASSIAFEPIISVEDDLDDYMATDCTWSTLRNNGQYHIRSVINHHGSSVNFGHYTADALRAVPVEHDADGGKEREWHRFNDDLVTKISESQAIQESSRSAYLVLYELD